MHWIFVGIAIGIGIVLTPFVLAMIAAPFLWIAAIGIWIGQKLSKPSPPELWIAAICQKLSKPSPLRR
jgi:hypothetical protein